MNRCARPGCRRKAYSNSNPFCCGGCRFISYELTAAHHLIEALGHTDLTDQYLTTAEDLNEVWAEAQQLRWQLRCLALDAGWSPEQFTALLRGRLSSHQSQVRFVKQPIRQT